MDCLINEKFPPVIKLSPSWIIYKIPTFTHLKFLSKNYAYTPEHQKRLTCIEHARYKGPWCAIYTNGSNSSSGVRFAAISPDKTKQFSMPKNAFVYKAELYTPPSANKITEDIVIITEICNL